MSNPTEPVASGPGSDAKGALPSGGDVKSVAAARSAASTGALQQARQQTAAAAHKIATLEFQQQYTEDRVALLEQSVQDLQNRDEQHKLAVDELTLRMRACETHSNHLEATVGISLQQHGIDITKLENSTDPLDVLTSQGVKLSDEEEANIKKIIQHSFDNIYGVGKFSMKEHGPYPSVGKSHISWPSRREGDRLIPVHRFDFNETYNSPRNNDSFLAWVEYSLNHGPAAARIPEPSDSVFNRATVTAACAKQYGYLKRRFKDMLANQAAPLIGIKRKEEDLDAPEFNPLDTLAASGASDHGVGGLIGGELGGEGVDNPFMGFDGSIGTAAAGWPIPPNPVDYNEILAAQAIQAKPEKVGVAKNLREALRSRRNTKLTIRTRKRHLLPPADEKYKGPKYDSYFTFGAMSEDETIEETNANGKKTQKFQARAWDFASDELVQIREAIDKVTDPVTSKQTERLRGPSKPGPPNKSRGVDTGMRTWMIKPEVMQQNPQWIHESRVYQSGPEWGESEPVKTEKPASKRVKVEAAPDLSLAQQTQGDWLQAKREVEKYSAMRRTNNNPGPST